MIKPEKGRLLIAEPSILNDSSFNRSIILLTEHTNKSAVGFILNRPLNYTIKDVLPEIDCDFTVYQGGPVEQDNLYFIHKIPHLITNSTEVKKGIYWGGNFDVLNELLNTKQIKNTDIRFFLGYSGWSTTQLKQELNTNSWFVTENDFDNILSEDNDTIWKNKLLQKGGEYKIWANAPSDIQLN
ncbi:putative transcriptional regulator [Lutibacter sp. Hel_I_33_5]|uniref:YqgE/AlgH family protein n=1 Tax=Lutibacter sp. Hel_I_33_5 TaxID=1566289 RepID=UPI0011A353E1|nr:YqgE/AlgH family protein [Lutibacter sp. Hel_I_33_5]TVZ57234.1 putative transcriptional regulator [Lutibacter sp. Hel_I_33_5]